MTSGDEDAYNRSVGLLREAASPDGYLASITPVTNYRRIWARDGVICGLAGLLTGDPELTEALKQTLLTLARQQTPQGHIPSNVYTENGQAQVSLGGLAGRADTISWFVIGVCNYAHLTGDLDFAHRMRPAIDKGLALLQAWEYNNRGLLYVPQSGDWADEYILHGYVLYDQVLRLWALRCVAAVFDADPIQKQAVRLTHLLETNYWGSGDIPADEELYHAHAYQVCRNQHGTRPYWLSGFAPGGYSHRFDPLANALCLMLGLGLPNEQQELIGFASGLALQNTSGLLPAFHPAILPGEAGWDELSANHKYEFRNHPHEFHNGGLWPMLNGWWGVALCQSGHTNEARNLLDALHRANRLNAPGEPDWGFYENFHGQTGQPLGTPYCTWSAAGAVLVHEYLLGIRLLGFRLLGS